MAKSNILFQTLSPEGYTVTVYKPRKVTKSQKTWKGCKGAKHTTDGVVEAMANSWLMAGIKSTGLVK